MKTKRVKTIMAYFIMPLFFSLIGIGLVIAISFPLLSSFKSLALVMTGANYNQNKATNVIFNEEIASKAIDENLESGRESIELSEVTVPANATQYGMISCERIGFLAPLFLGDDNKVLRQGVGQYLGSSMPGFSSPILLCGHNTTYCLPLQFAREGDIITITTNYGLYEYKIRETKILNMNEPTAFNLSAPKEELILYTCYPFDLIGSKTDRLFIYADKISGPVINVN